MSGLENLNSIIAILGIFVIFIAIIGIACLVIYIIGMWKLFQKAGKQGWESIIPFYNSWILVEISGLAWWWFLLLIAPTILGIIDDNLTSLASLIVLLGNFCCFYNISKKLHKDTGFAVLTTLFAFIMVPIIGLSNKYQFDASVEVSDIGPFGKTTTNTNNSTTNTNTSQNKDINYCPNCGKEINKNNTFCQNCGTKLK